MALGTLLGVLFVYLFFLVFFSFIVAIFTFWIWMLVDCVKRNFKKSDDKLIWILIIIFVQIIGAIIYYFVIKRKKQGERR